MSMFVLVSWLGGYFESLAFFKTRVVEQDVLSRKSAAILTTERGQTKQQIDIEDLFQQKTCFRRKLVAFWTVF